MSLKYSSFIHFINTFSLWRAGFLADDGKGACGVQQKRAALQIGTPAVADVVGPADVPKEWLHLWRWAFRLAAVLPSDIRGEISPSGEEHTQDPYATTHLSSAAQPISVGRNPCFDWVWLAQVGSLL
jgi:hypothetical protein